MATHSYRPMVNFTVIDGLLYRSDDSIQCRKPRYWYGHSPNGQLWGGIRCNVYYGADTAQSLSYFHTHILCLRTYIIGIGRYYW